MSSICRRVLRGVRWAAVLLAVCVAPTSAQENGGGASGSGSTLQTRVWVNASSHVYHCPGTRWYGNTRDGEFMVEAAARGGGNRAAGGKGCTSKTSGPAPLPNGMGDTDEVVWVNTESGVYHCRNARDFGLTLKGKYMIEAAARSDGHRAAAGKKCH